MTWLYLPCKASNFSQALECLEKDCEPGAGGEFAKQVTNWPTPQCSDEKRDRGSMEQKQRWSERDAASSELSISVALWPTPNAQQYGGTAEQHLARKAKMDGGARTTISELNAYINQWPTPATRDYKGTNSSQHMNRTDGRTDGAGIMPTNCRISS